MKRLLVLIIIPLFLLLLRPQPALAASISWDGDGDGDYWGDPLNWSGDVLPGADDDITIDVGSTINIASYYDVAYGGTASGTFTTDESALFDNTIGTNIASGVAGTHTIIYDFGIGSSKTVTKYSIRAGNNSFYAPGTWTFQASNNGSDWTTLDSITSQSNWQDYERRVYSSFSNSENIGAYRYYRWYTLQSSSIFWQVYLSELELLSDVSGFVSMRTVNSLTLGNASGTSAAVINFNYDAHTVGTFTLDDGDLTIHPGTIITHSAGTSTAGGSINIEVSSGNAFVSGQIIANAKGLKSSEGDGSPTDDGWENGGGGYGGHGGSGGNYAGGSTYGSLSQPTSLGSGGGHSNSDYPGGYGGGAIKLTVGSTLSVGGTIAANGGNYISSSHGAGGGSGGSVYLITSTLIGSGTVTSNGGNGVTNTGGGGGGGRIAVYYDTDNSSISYRAYGGTGKGFGGAGTIYIKDNATENGNLLIDNNNQDPYSGDHGDRYIGRTTLNGTYTFNTITISNYANLNVGTSDSITYSSLDWSTKGIITDNGGTFALLATNADLTIPATAILFANTQKTFNSLTVNGVLTHSSNVAAQTYKIDLTVTGDMSIGSSGSVNVNAKGLKSSEGDGSPSEDGSSNGGAGHGGTGGGGANYAGGSGYGSLTQPISLGSGGGRYTSSYLGGYGGGAIELNVGATLSVGGTIAANGGNYLSSSFGSGGGSGGSVYLIASTLTGSGTITSNGGNGVTGGGGGGGGGRIAVYYNTDNSSLIYRAFGGTGFGFGGAGTIYVKDNAADNGNLLLDNNDQNPLSVTHLDRYNGRTTLNGTYVFNTVTIRNYANLNVGTSDSITHSSIDWSTKGVITDNSGNITLLAAGGDLAIPATSILFANTARTFNSLTVNGILTHSGNIDAETYKIDLTITTNMTIGTSGSAIADSLGYDFNNGPGTPATTGSAGGNGGAGHAGAGGDGRDYGGGTAYGSLLEPESIGSGGGGYNAIYPGGYGGGAIKLNVGATLTINGSISVNGGNNRHTSYGPGGGSGGSINIATSTLAGSANITANGGNGDVTAGGGSGGRIAIYYANNTLSGTITATGGTGLNNGSVGSIVQQATSGYLISSPFNTEDSGAVLNQISWVETRPEGTDVKFQLRTASDSNGSPGSWSNWLGPSGVDSYYTDPSGGETINPTHTDTSNDQWFQYMAILTSSVGSTATPILDQVSVEYVVNTAPTVTITNSPVQSSAGVVSLAYTVSDPEETSFTAYILADIGITTNEELSIGDSAALTLSDASKLPSSGDVLIDSEMISYTGKSGNDLTGLTRGANNTRAAAHSSGTALWFSGNDVGGDAGAIGDGDKTITWTPASDLSSLETATATLKILVNDGNSANQLASDTVSDITLDTQAPTGGDIVIDSRLDRLTLSATDTNDILMKISNSADMSADDSNDDSGSWIDFATPKVWVMPSGTETVYVSYKDVYGNEIGSTLATTAPTRPNSLMIQDASNPDTEEWRLFVSWAVTDDPPLGFNYYQVYRSTDNETFSTLTQVSTRTQNFYLDENLDNETTYYYKVTLVDDHGNESSYNPVSQTSGMASRSGVGLVPDGSGGGDYTAPVISNLAAASVTATSAVITWDTDELSNSTVGYSTDTSYTAERGIVTVTTDHSVTLTGLTPSTKYYYRAISYDAVSNKATEEDSSTYYFTTSADTQGPVISQVNSAVGETTVGITWATDEAADSVVYYGLTTDYGTTAASTDDVFGHSLLVTGLTSDTTYYYYVASTDAQGNGTTSPGYNFTTTTPTSATTDTTAPTISNISVSSITSTSAKVSWETNEDADGRVEYGESTSYERGLAEGNHDYKKSKSVTVIGLSPETTYHYRVIAVDEAGNVNTSSNATFTTAAASVLGALTQEGTSSGDNAPAITSDGASITDVTGTSVTVTWKTSKKSTSQVYYKIKNSSDDLSSGGDATTFITDHSISLTGLTPATAYEYQVKSADVNGNYVISSKYEFTTTLPDVTSVKVTSISENSATISWTTLVPTSSAVEYINSFTGESKASSNASLVTNHRLTLNDLYADTIYAFHILIKDESGNLARSSQYSFTTSDDFAGPQISAVSSRSTIVSGQNKVQTVITWSTNEPSTSQVQYSAGSASSDEFEFSTYQTDDSVTNHIVVISNLKPATVYRYRVVSADRSQNSSISQNYVLLTPQKEVSALDLIFQNLEGVFGWTKKITQ